MPPTVPSAPMTWMAHARVSTPLEKPTVGKLRIRQAGAENTVRPDLSMQLMPCVSPEFSQALSLSLVSDDASRDRVQIW